MPFGYEETRLWSTSLAPRPDDPYFAARSKLSAEYHNVRERAALIAAEIPQDLREYTVHDVTHLDALWELADQVSGDGITLTPTEAFVLGGAFLIHDLGMGLAAWPGGLKELENEPGWLDNLASAVADITGRPARGDELANPPEEALRLAKEVTLRERHALHAADLPLISWPSAATGATYNLIENVDLRTRFGNLIGEIAASHWWNIQQVADRFGREAIGAPVDCPDEWTVDALKLACLMRLADAAHLDERRAPGFLRALRSTSGYSDLHWSFQGHLHRPRRTDDRLVYTSARPFQIDEAQAWWICFDSLRMVDGELHKVDALLADRGNPRFAAKSVKGIDDPARLAELIPTAGWQPVDAAVKVSNVAGLVRKLGGESLYGNHSHVALRELLQNARDASHALAAVLHNPPPPLRVMLHKDGDDGAFWLTVADTGIGMSKQVVTGALLDFGTSYWGSQLMKREAQGLASSNFRPAGRFGIGFFSVFMLGDQVRVISRRFDEASAETKVLEFSNGVWDRPLFRYARGTELMHTGGTRVSVRLRVDPAQPEGLLAPNAWPVLALRDLCAMIAPSFDCDIDTQYCDKSWERAVSAGDWLTMEPEDLLRRLSVSERVARYPNLELELSEVASRVAPIAVDGVVVARATLAPAPPAALDNSKPVAVKGAATVGGLLSHNDIGGVAGIFAASAVTADRLGIVLNIPRNAWQRWATDQAESWAPIVNPEIAAGPYSEMDGMVDLVCRLGGDPGPLLFCRIADRFLTLAEFREWAAEQEEVVAYNKWVVDFRGPLDDETIWLADEHIEITLGEKAVLIHQGGRYGSWQYFGDEHPDKTFKPEIEPLGEDRDARAWYYLRQSNQEGLAIRAIAEAWGQELGEVLSRLEDFDYDYVEGIGTSVATGETCAAMAMFRIRRS